MPNQKVISMLGLARRAGKLSMGHDMAQHALVIKTDITIDEIYFGVGYKAGCMTVNDENFAKKIISLLNQ